MKLEKGDKVRIISKDLTGTVCDIQKYKDGPEVVIVEYTKESGDGEYTHGVISADARDVEKL